MIAIADGLADLLQQNGVDLLLGSTLVLASFSLMVLLCRSLAGKHRLAGTAIVAIAVYALFAVVPLPRFAITRGETTGDLTAAASATTPASMPAADVTPPALLAAAGNRPPLSQPLADHRSNEQLAITSPAALERLPVATDTARLADWLAWLLLGGALLFGAQLLLGWLRLCRILHHSKPAPHELAQEADLPKHARLRITGIATQPFCCGLLRGTIVLPATMCALTSATRFVLRHESAHLRSGDARLRTVAALLRPLLFWHPLFWWLQHQLRFTGELLADDAAAEGSVGAYVRCMMTLATKPVPSTAGTLVATVFRRRSELFRRLEMMLQRDVSLARSPSPWQRRLRAVSAVALVTVSAGVFGVERAVAQDPDRQQRLRAEVAELRATIRELHAELVSLRATAIEARTPTLPSAPMPLPGAGGRTSAVADAPPDGLPGMLGQATSPGGAAPQATYRVQKGDTLARISQEVYGGHDQVDRLLQLNPGIDPRRLRVGQKLIIGRKPWGTELPRAADAPTGFPLPPGAPGARAQAPARPLPDASSAFGPSGHRAKAANPAPSPSATLPTGAVSAEAPHAARAQASSAGLPGVAALVSRAIELHGEVEIQEIELAYAQAAVDKGVASKREADIAKIRLRTKKRQYEALRSMIDGELDKAKLELAHAQQLLGSGFVTAGEVQAAQNRVKLLKQALR